MFIQPCFIRKNTPELRKNLEELGYEPYRLIKQHPNIWHGISSFTNSTYYGLGKNELENYAPKEHYEGKHFVDCGTNEELFLALAALRDDSDYMQWFTDEEKWFKFGGIIQNGFIIDKETHLLYHKATVEEIIEHFK